MLERLIHFSLRQRLLTFLVALFVAGWGAVELSAAARSTLSRTSRRSRCWSPCARRA